MATRSTKMSGQKDRKSWGSRTNPPLLAMGSPVGSDDERLDVDTILVAQLRGRSQQASESQVKSHLKEEAETVATKPENSLVYANVRGFGVLENLDYLVRTMENQTRELNDQKLQLEKLRKESQSEIRELKSETRELKSETGELKSGARVSKRNIEALESEAEESKSRSETQERNLLELGGRVKNLTSISQGYLDIRMRFLDNYNKKVKRDPNFQQTTAIEIGNQRAHGGDAEVDALLFRDQKRPEDPETYKELYGVDHSKALQLADAKDDGKIEARIFNVLNARGTQVAAKRPFPTELENAFKLYLAKLDKVGVGKAYSNFWKMYNKEYPLRE